MKVMVCLHNSAFEEVEVKVRNLKSQLTHFEGRFCILKAQSLFLSVQCGGQLKTVYILQNLC